MRMLVGRKNVCRLFLWAALASTVCAAQERQHGVSGESGEAASSVDLAALPYGSWSTEELTAAARRGDRKAIAALAAYWMEERQGKLPDTYEDVLGPKPEDAPWSDDATHWAAYWLRRWRDGGDYGVLASRLEQKLGTMDVWEDPAWVELAAASARLAEADCLRDGLDAALGAMKKAKVPAAAKLKLAVRAGIKKLRDDARRGVRGAAARYELLTRAMPEENEEAWRLVSEAARKGDVSAMGVLVWCSGETINWYQKACEHGDIKLISFDLNSSTLGPPSVRNALTHGSFRVCIPDANRRSHAERLLRERGDQKALIRGAERLLASPSEAGREERLREAEKYLKRAADQGVGRAALLLCRLYEGKFGGKPEPAKACATARAMTAAHYAPGYLKLADYKEKGYGNCARDFADAYALVERAAQSRMPEALVQWARLLMRGIGTAPDPAKAARILQAVHAKAPNTPRLYFMLGYMYETGTGVPADLGKALKFYTLGADSGDSRAINNLGLMYEEGLGVAQDREKALEMFRRAAELGNEDGKANSERVQSGK